MKHSHNWEVYTERKNPDGSTTYYLRCSCGETKQQTV